TGEGGSNGGRSGNQGPPCIGGRAGGEGTGPHKYCNSDQGPACELHRTAQELPEPRVEDPMADTPTSAATLRAKSAAPPVDPNVLIPKSVREQADRAAVIQQAVTGQVEAPVHAPPIEQAPSTPPNGSSPPAPSPQADEPAPPTPASPPAV